MILMLFFLEKLNLENRYCLYSLKCSDYFGINFIFNFWYFSFFLLEDFIYYFFSIYLEEKIVKEKFL